MEALPTLGGANGYAAGNNHHGQTVGWAENKTLDPTCVAPQVLQFEAVTWEAGDHHIRILPPLPGDPDGAATANNDLGQVVGISGDCYKAVGASTARHAVLWENGTPIDLKSLGGNNWNTPTDINERGEVVGFSDLPGDAPDAPNFHAFYWSKATGMIDLGTYPGDVYSEALGINKDGQIVGESCSAGFAVCRAVIFTAGKVIDLNSLTTASLYLVFANDINDRGEIAGGGYNAANGKSPAFLATQIQDDDNLVLAPPQTQATPAPAVLPNTVRDALARRNGLDLSKLK
jgi:probable HAF family extracellular repeat protein